jgi:hypothetical protein
LIAEETGQFSDADTLSGSLHLDERIVALHSRPGVFHRLAQEECTGRGRTPARDRPGARNAGEGDQGMSGKPFSSLWRAVLSLRPVWLLVHQDLRGSTRVKLVSAAIVDGFRRNAKILRDGQR